MKGLLIVTAFVLMFGGRVPDEESAQDDSHDERDTRRTVHAAITVC